MVDVIDNIIYRMQHKPTEDKNLTNLKHRGICYYSVLGVAPTATQLELKKAYQKKLTRYHPDKIEQTPVNLAKYKLIREAGDTLLNEQRRKAYDMEQDTTEMPTDFVTQKTSFKEFVKLQEPECKETKQPPLRAEQQPNMSREEHTRRYEDTLMQREMEEVETTHSNIFAGRQFDAKEFNKMFIKKSRHQKDKEIVKVEEISAYCDGGDIGAALDGTETLGLHKDIFAPIDTDKNDDDNISIDSLDDTANQEEEKLKDTDIEKIVADRKKIDKTLETFADAEYSSAINDKFGVSHGLGFLVGTQMFGSQIRKPNIVIDDDKINAYKSLLNT